MTVSKAELESIAARIEVLADETSKPLHRHIARVLRGDRIGGRPPQDDAEHLDQVRALLGADPSLEPRQACACVARRSAPPSGVRAMTRRLFRKLGKMSLKRLRR